MDFLWRFQKTSWISCYRYQAHKIVMFYQFHHNPAQNTMNFDQICHGNKLKIVMFPTENRSKWKNHHAAFDQVFDHARVSLDQIFW